MRPSATYTINYKVLPPSRIRLLEAHQEKHSWHKVAGELKLNFRYVYNYAVYGRLPRNRFIRRKLLGRKSINEHLSQDPITEMPTPLLAWALQYREEMA